MSARASGIFPLSSWNWMSTVRPSEGDHPAQPRGSLQPSDGLWRPLSASRKSSRTAIVTSSAENASWRSRCDSYWRTSTRRSLPAFSMKAVRATAVKMSETRTSTMTEDRSRGSLGGGFGGFTMGSGAPGRPRGRRRSPRGSGARRRTSHGSAAASADCRCCRSAARSPSSIC